MLAAFAIPNFAKAVQTTTYHQTLVNEAQIACALERYQLARHEYPATLAELVPQYLATLPHDLIGGAPCIIAAPITANSSSTPSAGMKQMTTAGPAPCPM